MRTFTPQPTPGSTPPCSACTLSLTLEIVVCDAGVRPIELECSLAICAAPLRFGTGQNGVLGVSEGGEGVSRHFSGVSRPYLYRIPRSDPPFDPPLPRHPSRSEKLAQNTHFPKKEKRSRKGEGMGGAGGYPAQTGPRSPVLPTVRRLAQPPTTFHPLHPSFSPI
jgi:hypothetical protein